MARYRVVADKVTLEVSEHALLRFLQRVKKVDIDQALLEMFPEGILETIELCSSLKYKRGSHFACGTHAIVMDENLVVTVLSPEMVDAPSDEWNGWVTSAVLRPVPVAGTPYEMVIDLEVKRRVNDEAWKRRQDHEALKAARLHTSTIEKRYERRIQELEKSLSEAKAQAHASYQQMIEEGRLHKSNAAKICDHVKKLLGPEKYAELEQEALGKAD